MSRFANDCAGEAADMTQVFAINGSPRAEKGNTDLVLKPFLEGMREAGASTELFYASRLNIKPCTGDFKCWYQSIGECYMKDDMREIYPKLRRSDILVLATPVYIPLPGRMQDFLNRLLPLIEPILETRRGRTRAKYHDDVRMKKIALVSASGWWELGNFGSVVRIVEELAEVGGVEFAGALLRPHSYLLAESDRADEIFEAARSAGRQLVKEGRISPETLSVVSQPLMGEEAFRLQSNETYSRARAG